MDYVEARKEGDQAELIGFHCDHTFDCIKQISADFESVDIDGFEKDGVYVLKVIFNPAEYIDGGLANGSWNDFKVIDYKPFET